VVVRLKKCFLQEFPAVRAILPRVGKLARKTAVAATFFPGDLRWLLSTARAPLFFRHVKMANL